jgi:hypothetical protein
MVPLISQSLDRRLNIVEFIKVKVHLLVCIWCSRYLRQIRMIRELVRLPNEDFGLGQERLSIEARERIHGTLEERSR